MTTNRASLLKAIACTAVITVAASTAPAPARAQSAHGPVATPCDVNLGRTGLVSPTADLARIGDITGPESRHSWFIRRPSDQMRFDACTLPASLRTPAQRLSLAAEPERGAAVLPAAVRTVFNSGYPRDWNDGAIWGGAGLSTGITAGAGFRWDRFEAVLAPLFAVSQNASFDTHVYPDPLYSRWVHRWHGRFIDLPQRFGVDPVTDLGSGQSYVRVNFRQWRAGFSTENIAWGAARRNPLLLSGTSDGFPHVFIETAQPHDVWIGDAELQVFWARLSESPFFDLDPINDHRMMSGIIATIKPRGLDGLYLGAGRLNTQTWRPGGIGVGELLYAPFSGMRTDGSGLPRDLRLYGVFARWVAAPSGFEVYGEWARQDSWQEWMHLLNRVDAAQAYTLGLQKVTRRGDTAIRFSAEVSHLSDAVANRELGRGLTTYYVSPAVTQGHTHRGQLLGAPIGPGSEAQFIGMDVFWSAGRTGFSIERARYDDDAYYAVWGSIHGPHGHDTEMSFAASHFWAGQEFSFDAEFGYSFRYNRALLGLHHGNHAGFPYRRDTSVALRMGGRWTPRNLTWQP